MRQIGAGITPTAPLDAGAGFDPFSNFILYMHAPGVPLAPAISLPTDILAICESCSPQGLPFSV
jgi:hypothetical protein